MSWPLASDFSRMLQNPRFAFRDPQLQHCRIELDRLGQPRPRSGNFATVYRVYRPDGGAVAIKVFNRQIEDRKNRYRAVSEYLSRHPVPSLVDFDYDERGIRAPDGQLYPLLSMQWVEGVTLFEWAAEQCRLGDRAALTRAAEAWADLTRDLAAHSIVHGDLQPGNILVTADSQLRLVDYDGMAVPDLLGQPSPEVGLPPYQHPGRDPATAMTPGMDHFSALLIYTALRALALSPALWTRHVVEQNSDKLLFQTRDWVLGEKSAMYRDLIALDDAEARGLAQYMFLLAAGSLDRATAGADLRSWRSSLDALLADLRPKRESTRPAPAFDPLPPSPTLAQDRLLIAATSQAASEEAAPPASPAYRQAEERLARCEALRSLTQDIVGTLEREREILRAARDLPEGYDPSLAERVRAARERLTAHRQLLLASKAPASDLSIATAWLAIQRSGAERLVGAKDSSRIDLALARLPLLKALAEQICDVFPAAEMDARLLKLWSEPLLGDCHDAAPWRERYEAIRRRAGVEVSIAASRIDRDIRRALVMANGRARPAAPDDDRWLLKRQALVESVRRGDLAHCVDDFDVSLVRLICRHAPALAPEFAGWMAEHILPSLHQQLAKVRAGAISRHSDGRCRIRWNWPPPGWFDALSVAIVWAPAADVAPSLDTCLWSNLIARGEAPTGELLAPAMPEWRSAFVVAWAHLDLGFQQFVSPPATWGQILH